MFGLFKKKPTKEEFLNAKQDGTIYPSDSISVLQIQTENGNPATAWINKGYKDYKYKSFCPWFVKLSIGFNLLSETELENIDMAEIEDFIEEKFKAIGIAHFIARFVTDGGMDLLLYTEPLEKFEELINHLMDTNKFNLDIDCELHSEDFKWHSMKMVLN